MKNLVVRTAGSKIFNQIIARRVFSRTIGVVIRTDDVKIVFNRFCIQRFEHIEETKSSDSTIPIYSPREQNQALLFIESPYPLLGLSITTIRSSRRSYSRIIDKDESVDPSLMQMISISRRV